MSVRPPTYHTKNIYWIMATNTEEILIKLGLDSSSLREGLKQAAGESRKTLVEGFRDIGADILKGFTAGAIMGKIEAVFGRVKELKAGSETTGFDLQEFQRLAELANEDLPEGAAKFQQAMTKLNVKLGEGAQELEQWGIKSTTAKDAVYEIADKMHAIHDPAERAAMAVELMGRSGAEMVPFLERGADALKRMAESKLSWSKEDIEAIERAHQNIEEAGNWFTFGVGKAVGKLSGFFSDLGHLSAGDLGTEDPREVRRLIQEWQQAQRDFIGSGEFSVRSRIDDTPGDKAGNDLDAIMQKRLERMQTETAKINDQERKILELKKQIADLDKQSGDHAAERHALLLQIAQAEEKIFAIRSTIERRIASNNRRLATAGEEFPTLENLAGREWTRRFEGQYGPGGRFDLGRGDGPLGEVAREAIRARRQQVWDRSYGFTAAAEMDRMRMISATSTLSRFGAASADQNLMLIAEQTRAMQTAMADILAGRPITTNINGVNEP